MALLNEILKWTEDKLPLWQRDAARRLFQKNSDLSGKDYQELYALLKAAHNLPNPLNLKPEPLEDTHLPKSLQAGEIVILTALRDLKNVNRIAAGQTLKFAAKGMTVIYGGNGSGKSGYVRVMKRACRARDQSEPVLTDATDQAFVPSQIPEAVFDIDINGAAKTVQWNLANKSPDELATFAVFDSHCARSYLTSEEEVAYLPYGLDVVETLANRVLPELSRRLAEELSAISVDPQPFQHLHGPTKVGQMMLGLSSKTNVTEITTLGTVSQQEAKRIEDLNNALAEADPSSKAKQLKLSALRIKTFSQKAENSLIWVKDTAIERLKQLDEDTVAACDAERQAAETLQSGETLLPGTGEAVWKTLFEAARKFSTGSAYPGHAFPHTEDDSVCPLCQQSLRNAGERLQRFEKYIKDDVAKVVEQQRQRVKTVETKIENADLRIGMDESMARELVDLDETVVSIADAFQKSIELRRAWMLSQLKVHSWRDAPALNESPRLRLRNLAARQLRLWRVYTRAIDNIKKQELTNELAELMARRSLSACIGALVALVERMQKKVALESCNNALRTKPISDKSKEFAANAVTKTFKDALDNEFRCLGISHIKTRLKERNDKGKIKHQLLLDLPRNNNLDQILSEGEQRAVALASFLAELKLANHGNGIIFDDPVSSLDHRRRGRLAFRLAIESGRRQILVFTHDVIFLHQLRDECDKHGVPILFCFLEAYGGYFGNVSDGLPWAHKSYGERIDRLEKAQKKFEKLPWPPDPSEELSSEMIREYSFLRATIERVVQDVVLNATVQRFRDYIEVKRLTEVVGTTQKEVDEICRLYQRCNDVVEAHDPSSAKDEPPPTPDELNQDIIDLKKLISDIKARRK